MKYEKTAMSIMDYGKIGIEDRAGLAPCRSHPLPDSPFAGPMSLTNQLDQKVLQNVLERRSGSEVLDSFRVSWKDEVLQSVLERSTRCLRRFFHCVCSALNGDRVVSASSVPAWRMVRNCPGKNYGARCLGKENL